jgi:glycosyltransferase involved in cell wall biosynthesis/peptidoglycan/xylan/chitin deacetylase (PgdA/CDA1 family)
MGDSEADGIGAHRGTRRPRISVVLPTYQRRELVTAAVRALADQSFDQPFEVIVAVDGSTDGSADTLRAMSVPFPLTVLEQPNGGAATARNLGACRARGDIVLFLDDDMEADPHLLAEHDRVHRQGADAVLGHMPLHPASAGTVLGDAVAQWSDERLARLSQPGAVLGLHDLLTGQLSVSRQVFAAIGGFDSWFTRGGSFGNEDVDLGYRLLAGDYDVRFNPDALSYQRYEVTPRQHLRQWRQAGQADVLFARKHPLEALGLFELNGLRSRFARRVARPLARAPLWRLITWPIRALAILLGDRRGRVPEFVFFRVRAIEYWRGVHEAGDVPRCSTVRVLAYHSISDLRGHGVLEPYGVPPGQFRRQVSALVARGFHPVSAEEFAAFVEGRAGVPRRALLFTFDDCYSDLPEAVAVLQAEGFGAVAFAVSGLLGGDNVWDRVHGGPALGLLDAEGLRRLRDQGVEIGGHSRTHPQLPTLPPRAVEAEVRGCVADLEAAGLEPVRFFAFPYGEHDERVRKAVSDAGFIGGFAIDPGVMDAGTDPMRIPRVEIRRADQGIRFLAKVLFAREPGWAAAVSRRTVPVTGRVARRWRRRIRRVLARLSPVAGGRSPTGTQGDRSSQSAEPAAAAGQEPPR